MNKKQLVAAIAERAGISKILARKALDSILEAVGETLKQGKAVGIVNFGSFSVSQTKPRVGRNPRTKQRINIPSCNKPTFKAGQGLKRTVNPAF
ncbi:DNA-binding protein HRm [Pseudomonas reidholzensis]|uniref:DNA-binding protein HRm n=1 Tax=Pseudomonas reidholzensis TaxID=1785162 RepID=A0A383RTL1_9PSED|nr:HU family DNA-binding protein [Pseudomonas reidholzensis]SYX89761.1 DNA-binding protein HRm [Pseudomonas reidholzensis]